MQLDPQQVADTRAWLMKARNDLRAAETDLAASPPLLEDVLFHCQQAAEKAMKALLTWHDQPFRKTHDLVEIGGQCVEIDAELEPLLRHAAPLSEFAGNTAIPESPKSLPEKRQMPPLPLPGRSTMRCSHAFPLRFAPDPDPLWRYGGSMWCCGAEDIL